MLLTNWMTRSSTDAESRLSMTAGRREAPGAGQEAGAPEQEADQGVPEEGPGLGLAAGRGAGPGPEAAPDPEEREVPREMRSPGASQGPRVGRSPAPPRPRRRRVAQDPDPSPGALGVARTER